MELQLGLALPNGAATNRDPASETRNGIDLNLNLGICGRYHGCTRERQQYCQFRLEEVRGIEERTRGTVPRTLLLLHGADEEGNGCGDDYEYMDTDSSDYHRPNRASSSSGGSNFVKVAMEGIGIGRKVDLSLHHSFHALKDSLLPMFGIYNEDSDNYKLAYQDRGGQWVTAEDSSWRNFTRSAQRLKINKLSDDPSKGNKIL